LRLFVNGETIAVYEILERAMEASEARKVDVRAHLQTIFTCRETPQNFDQNPVQKPSI